MTMATTDDRTTYMDHNATTPTDPRVLEAMLPFFSEEYGNPSSPYALAVESSARFGYP